MGFYHVGWKANGFVDLLANQRVDGSSNLVAFAMEFVFVVLVQFFCTIAAPFCVVLGLASCNLFVLFI